MDKHEIYMQKAVELAEKARGKCSPNPFVGAVIVKNDKVIGVGYTQAYGFDHAEVQAIKNSSEDCSGAQMYVTLEPCSHFGKTPPCTKAIIESGITAVFIGILDPNPLVSGKGVQALQSAGIEVQTGFLPEIITRQLEYYLTYITKKRSFVFLKSGISLDGRIAARDGTARWISCVESRQKTHELRQEADALLTGIGTVLKDNPLLNVRLENPYKQPMRVILDTRLNFPLDSDIARSANKQKTLIFTSLETSNPAKEKALADLGIEIVKTETADSVIDLTLVLKELYQRKITVVMVEAGSRVNASFLKKRLIDKLIMFIAPKLLGGNHLAWHDIGIDNIEQALELKDIEYHQIGADMMLTGYPNPDMHV